MKKKGIIPVGILSHCSVRIFPPLLGLPFDPSLQVAVGERGLLD